MKEIIPFGTRVVARRIDIAQELDSGLIVANASSKETSNAAEVVFIGPECVNVKPGDKIIFINHGNFKFLGENLVVFFEADILGLLK